jgi:hypothetical protein
MFLPNRAIGSRNARCVEVAAAGGGIIRFGAEWWMDGASYPL